MPSRSERQARKIPTAIAPGAISPGLNGPRHIAVDRDDNVMIADAENHLIRKYNPRDNGTMTIAGTGEKWGDIYISDSYNHRILRLRQ